ncbi:hypothetical protein ACQ4PT_010027 [Festuca glaucescens]
MELFMAAAEAGGIRDGLEAAQASAGDARVSYVVGDAFVWMAAEAVAATGAPWVPVWTAASCALLAHIRTDALRQDVVDQVQYYSGGQNQALKVTVDSVRHSSARNNSQNETEAS